MKRLLIIFILIAGVSAVVWAGGPWVVDDVANNGEPQKWLDNQVIWFSDAGDYSGTVDNTTAVGWLADAFNRWTVGTIKDAVGDNVTVANITATYGGNVAADINATNYGPYWTGAEGPTIIFDKDGEILTDLLGSADYLGLTNEPVPDSTHQYIVNGTVILNGLLLSDGTLTEDESKAVMTHELGHFMNLDHSQVNADVSDACTFGGTCDHANRIPTMYPMLKTSEQLYPVYDDIITLGFVYPTDDFNSKFATIEGEILDSEGNPAQGVAVVAYRYGSSEAMARIDARGMVSGVLYPAGTANGKYYLKGILPGEQYRVFYEPIGSDFTGASNFEPLGDASPGGFDPAYILGDGCEETVGSDDGGATIGMTPAKIGVVEACDAGGGGCSLVKGLGE